MKAAGPKFDGLLATPIQIDDTAAGDPAGDAYREALDRAAWQATYKLVLLAAHYGISLSPEDGGAGLGQLAMALATDFVPGFRIEHRSSLRRGRPKLWSPAMRLDLVIDVERVKRRNGCGDRAALQTLILHSEFRTSWGQFAPKGASNDARRRAIDSLETRLGEARRAMPLLYEVIKKFPNEVVDEWNGRVRQP